MTPSASCSVARGSSRNAFWLEPLERSEYAEEVLLATDPESRPRTSRFSNTRRAARRVPRRLPEEVDWSRYAWSDSDHLSADDGIAGARSRIKQHHPEITICLGGELRRRHGADAARGFPQIDLVFSGEADETFPLCVKEIFAGRPIPRCSGILARAVGPCETPAGEVACGPVQRPGRFPTPNSATTSSDLGRVRCAIRLNPCSFSSRREDLVGGRGYCTFCRLNGGSIAFRSKSARRRDRRAQTPARTVACRRPRHRRHPGFPFFRSMLRCSRRRSRSGTGVRAEDEPEPPQVDLLSAAGVRRRRLASKPLDAHPPADEEEVTASQNIQTLKWLTAAGMEVKWNFLYGFPGEDPCARRLTRTDRETGSSCSPQAAGAWDGPLQPPFSSRRRPLAFPPFSQYGRIAMSSHSATEVLPTCSYTSTACPRSTTGIRTPPGHRPRTADPRRSGKLPKLGGRRDAAQTRSPRRFTDSVRHPSCRQVF